MGKLVKYSFTFISFVRKVQTHTLFDFICMSVNALYTQTYVYNPSIILKSSLVEIQF